MKGAGATIGGAGQGVWMLFLERKTPVLIVTDRLVRPFPVLVKAWILPCKFASDLVFAHVKRANSHYRILRRSSSLMLSRDRGGLIIE